MAQSIDTLTLCSDLDSTCLDLAKTVAGWSIQNMLDAKGYYYYRQYPLMTAKIPMLHWGQATMFKALAFLLLQMKAPVSEASAFEAAPVQSRLGSS